MEQLNVSNLLSSTEPYIGGPIVGLTGGNETDVDAKLLNPRLTQVEIWGYGFLFVSIISLSSIMGILFFPLMKKSFYALLMRIMIGLAIGSLSGSSLFHLIPQAFDLGETHPDYLKTVSFVWFAIWGVMILECSIKIGVKMRAKAREKREYKLRGARATRAGASESMLSSSSDELRRARESPENNNPSKQNGVSNGYVMGVTVTSPGGGDRTAGGGIGGAASTRIQVRENSDAECDGDSDGDGDSNHNLNPSSSSPDDPHLNLNIPNLPVYRSTLSLNKVIDKINAREDEDVEEKRKEIKTVAWIIIIGDSLHNFIDGISIGAGFVQSFSTGAVLSLAIMCEEFPHELGDFAILINSGLSVKKALLLNFLSALTCYFGLALGILLGEIEWAHLIFAFAAGIFLYVALGDMVPEVTSLIDEVSDVSPVEAIKVMLTHNLGILIGSAILFVLAKYQ